jgi:hypothetical protein
MDWIDQKYIGLISNRVQLFKRQSNTSYNMRCPICGDSKTNKHKARGYVIEKPVVGVIYFCHNCHASMSLANFIGHLDGDLSEQYKRDRFLERHAIQEKPPEPNIAKVVVQKYLKGNEPLANIKKISQLSHEHPAKLYVQKRKIPSSAHYKLFFAPKFNAWVNSIIPEKLNEEHDQPRLVIPFIDRAGKLFGFQGRSFAKNPAIRYITIMLDDSKPKVFGLDNIDPAGVVWCVEGPIDSLFLPNCIAMAGADVDLNTVLPNKSVDEFVIIMDNEPRNEHIIKRIENSIKRGYSVCIWPDGLDYKDVNDMVLAGLDPEAIIRENTKSGLTALAALTQWKKI